jgi:hypothetical protein
MNLKKVPKNKSNQLSTKPFNSATNERILQNRIAKAINMTKRISGDIHHSPLYKYIAGLIDFDHVARSSLTPLLPGKYHLKTIRLTQTYQVSSSGNLKITFQPEYMTKPDSTSTFCYASYNDNVAYDPTSVVPTGLEDRITDFATALNLTETIMPRARTQSMHLKFHLTGVSNLNKQGTIHLMETLVSTSDALGGWAKTFNIPYAPLCEVYKQIEIANMDLSGAMQYNYFPLSNAFVLDQFNDVTNTTSSVISDVRPNKIFALIISGAAAGTKIRMEAELTAECEVENGYINTYPIEYTKCFIDSESTMCFLNQHPNLRINTTTNSGVRFLPTVFKEVNRQQNINHNYEAFNDLDKSSFLNSTNNNSRRSNQRDYTYLLE